MTKRRTSRASAQDQNLRRSVQVGAIVVIVALVAVSWIRSGGSDPLALLRDIGLAPTLAPTPVVATGGSDWWQVYFTDPANFRDPDTSPGPILSALLDRINNAKSSIHIAAFEFNLTPVAEALIAAHRRGVDVRWVTDDENGIQADSEPGRGQFAMLKDAGIEVKDDHRNGLMHNKFWIFDGQSVWTGSTNITFNGFYRNNNNAIVFDSPPLAAIYEREFDELWAGQFGVTSPSTADQQSATINGTPVQVWFAAEDEVADHLTTLIQGSRQRIRFMAFSFTHTAMGEAMLARAKAGVDVSGIFETRGSETEFSELPPFFCAGLAVRQDGNPNTFHHKVIVIDDQIVVTGSFNFSSSADKSNDENAVVITNADIAALYLQEFDRRWAEATPPDPADMNCN